MTQFRLVLVAASVALIGWNVLHRGTAWDAYEDVYDGWTIERPASATVQEGTQGVRFRTGTLMLTVRRVGPTKRPDTQLPLDPVDFLLDGSPSGGTTAHEMSVVSHHRAFQIQAVTAGSHDQAKAFRMLRSLRFS
jgi:hypothetical protein